MTRQEAKQLHLGLYKVYWKSEGYSLAAIGQRADGTRWLAPTNWLQPTEDQKVWASIERVVLIRRELPWSERRRRKP